MMAATVSAVASAVIATIRGRGPPAVRPRTVRAISAASSIDSSRGVPGTRLSPSASGPADVAATALPMSPTPQIFTNARRATLAGSAGTAPAGTNARAAALGSGERMRASPTRAPSKPCARQRAIVSMSRTPNSAMTRRSPGTRSSSRPARSGSTASVRRSRLFRPINRASVSSASRSSRSSCASTRGSRPRARAPSTSARNRRFEGCRTARMSTASAPAARRLLELAVVDDELLGEDRDRDGRANGAQVVDRAAEPVRLAQDRDRGRPAGLVGAGPGDDVIAASRRSGRPMARRA